MTTLCACMTEDPDDGYGERVVTHSLRCTLHPEHVPTIAERVAAMRKRPLYTVRKQSSGYTCSVTYVVFKQGGRVSVHAGSQAAAQSDADALNIGALVLDYAADPRPYAVRLAEAQDAWEATR